MLVYTIRHRFRIIYSSICEESTPFYPRCHVPSESLLTWVTYSVIYCWTCATRHMFKMWLCDDVILLCNVIVFYNATRISKAKPFQRSNADISETPVHKGQRDAAAYWPQSWRAWCCCSYSDRRTRPTGSRLIYLLYIKNIYICTNCADNLYVLESEFLYVEFMLVTWGDAFQPRLLYSVCDAWRTLCWMPTWNQSWPSNCWYCHPLENTDNFGMLRKYIIGF